MPVQAGDDPCIFEAQRSIGQRLALNLQNNTVEMAC
jgi:hypothetical protein